MLRKQNLQLPSILLSFDFFAFSKQKGEMNVRLSSLCCLLINESIYRVKNLGNNDLFEVSSWTGGQVELYLQLTEHCHGVHDTPGLWVVVDLIGKRTSYKFQVISQEMTFIRLCFFQIKWGIIGELRVDCYDIQYLTSNIIRSNLPQDFYKHFERVDLEEMVEFQAFLLMRECNLLAVYHVLPCRKPGYQNFVVYFWVRR